MGMLGLIFMLYILIVGGPLNSPTIAGIFTIVGFVAIILIPLVISIRKIDVKNEIHL